MKILFFCPYYPPHIGGLESHANEFNKYLSQRGMDITVFTPRLPIDALENEIQYNGVEIIRFPAFEIIANYPLPKFWSLKFWKMFVALFKSKYDITISRTRFFNTSFLTLIYAKIKKTRWIHIEHGSNFVQLSSRLKSLAAKLYDYTLGKLIFKTCDLNISISKAVQNFVYKFDKRESPIIYRGLEINDIEKIKPDLEIKEKYEDKTIISFVGRLYKWKGVENTVKAIKSLPKGIKQKIIFLIIGDGEDYNRIKNTIKSKDPIKMLGNLPREEAIGILKKSDIYVHSSLPGGGLSTSLLEAMYCGCSIIATPYEGANEIIKNNINGILISANGKIQNNIANSILKIINHRDNLKKLQSNAKKDIANKFKWNNSIKKYEKIFKN